MVGRLPVIEQVIELGIEMFRRRIPWLHEKVIDISLIDGADRGVRAGPGRAGHREPGGRRDELGDEALKDEIARMLGDSEGDAARRHAQAMLRTAAPVKQR